ncbi:serine carboxypeptidase 24-like isoform X2 [Abrus precatorius]|uniref:Serine carboxypeptidase 24-like isoform X2 n=1 Tax=Abrus precatorius TaxID=3816 RepID=A0A8B8LVC8_ABRPR|nr:serine carboxypeptidase 24-like isoform X2 [Abrus precatorius]
MIIDIKGAMMASQTKTLHLFFFFMCLLLSFSNISCIVAVPKEQEQDRIFALPGQPPVTFSQFSGYVTVNEQHGRALFYWFTEATTSPENKPLVLWLNGGPGCSSVAYGASEEIGPFRINKSGSSLYLNKYAWNRGHYVPQLAKKVHDYNKNNPHILNLKGFIVGNAVTDDHYDGVGTVTYWWSHSMISDQSYKSILKYCNFSEKKTTKKCDDAVNYAVNNEFGNIDQYSIYTPSCTTSHNDTLRHVRFKSTILHRISGYDPCTEDYAEKYYNRLDVQKAMHANVTNIPYKWTACSDALNKNWKDSEFSMLPIYKELIAAGLRIWVFSGDTDSVVPVTATRFSLSHLNLTIKTRWYPWYTGGQVGGWTEVYDGLTFTTVRGAGHEVPLLQPERAYILFRSFLAGKHLPKS